MILSNRNSSEQQMGKYIYKQRQRDQNGVGRQNPITGKEKKFQAKNNKTIIINYAIENRERERRSLSFFFRI